MESSECLSSLSDSGMHPVLWVYSQFCVRTVDGDT